MNYFIVLFSRHVQRLYHFSKSSSRPRI